jgi:transketolase
MAQTMRDAYGHALETYGAVNEKVVVLDVDTSSSTLTHFFAKLYPDRFFNIGIAEPCMVDVAVGFALGGKIPFANAFAALIALRALEQVRTNVAYAYTNVKLIAGYAGVSDFKDGATHYTITDIAIMRSLPGMTVIVPADSREAAAWVPVIAEYDGPVYMRISRDATLDVHHQPVFPAIGHGWQLRSGNDLTIIACGAMTGRALQAAEILAKSSMDARVLEIPCVKPLDETLILAAARETGAIVTAEEHSVVGGLGGAIAELLGEHAPIPLQKVGIQDFFARTTRNADAALDAFGMSVDDIIRASHLVFERKKSHV